MTDLNTTDRLLDLAATAAADIPGPARAMARVSLFDWLVVARAGTGEPLSRIIRDDLVDEGGKPIATMVGGARVPARAPAELCADPRLARIAETMDVTSDPRVTDSGAELSIETAGGQRIEVTHDLADRIPAAQLEHGLRNKARGLLGHEIATRLWSAVSGLDGASARRRARSLRF